MELKITAADVADAEAGVRWTHACLDQLADHLGEPHVLWGQSRAQIPYKYVGLLSDLLPLFHRMRDFLQVCPSGVGRIEVCPDQIYVVGVIWAAEKKEGA